MSELTAAAKIANDYRVLSRRHEALRKSMLDFAAEVQSISNFLGHEPDLQGDLRRAAAAATLAAR
jgi:hypothetical protein